MFKNLSKICLPILLVVLASCGRVPNTIGENGSPSCKYVDLSTLSVSVSLDVPYVEQLTNYCGPASLEMIFSYYGTNMSQQEIGAGIVGPQGVGADQLAQFSVDQGYDATKEYCGLSSLLEKLNSKTPVLVRVINNSGTNGHFMVVTGYDLITETIFINDPALPDNQEMSFNDFKVIWDIKTLPEGNNSSYLMLVIVPAETK